MARHYPGKRSAWVYILSSGIIGTGVYVGLNAFLSPEMTYLEMLFQAVFFFTIWIIVQALLNRRRYKDKN